MMLHILKFYPRSNSLILACSGYSLYTFHVSSNILFSGFQTLNTSHQFILYITHAVYIGLTVRWRILISHETKNPIQKNSQFISRGDGDGESLSPIVGDGAGGKIILPTSFFLRILFILYLFHYIT